MLLILHQLNVYAHGLAMYHNRDEVVVTKKPPRRRNRIKRTVASLCALRHPDRLQIHCTTMFAFSSSASLVVPIGYSIVNSSEHSGKYTAENIRIDNPNDQASRWSGASGAQPVQNLKQWILLRLDSVCVLS
jgi:hypothetical protein